MVPGMHELVCGIDVGTSAVRVLICDLQGQSVATAAVDLPPPHVDGTRREQDPEGWWTTTCTALRQALAKTDPAAVKALAVDATSGTITLVDRDLHPLTPGLMYNDGRAAGYAQRLNDSAAAFVKRHGYRFKDDFSLSKILWLKEHEPAFARAAKVLHQSDFINARLLGGMPATDWSNALKSGCDLFAANWPAFIAETLALPLELFPAPVVAPGTHIGEVGAAAAAATGLRAGTAVVTGASDGTASLFASGAGSLGDFNTCLGSTLIIKGISSEVVHDARGVIYCHRHPAGFWLPGGAGNVGCSALNREFAPDPGTRRATLQALDAAADTWLPSPVLMYPLGDAAEERFPFKKSGIRSFVRGTPRGREELYGATLQAVAFVERWCYEELAALGADAKRIFATGGGARSRAWCQLRADVLGKPLHLPAEAETVLGTAVLAAGSFHGGVDRAAAAMVRMRETLEPGGRDFGPAYAAFRAAVHEQYGV